MPARSRSPIVNMNWKPNGWPERSRLARHARKFLPGTTRAAWADLSFAPGQQRGYFRWFVGAGTWHEADGPCAKGEEEGTGQREERVDGAWIQAENVYKLGR